MARRRVDWLGTAGRGSIAAAIVGRAEMRSALEYLAWNLDVRLTAVVARLLPAAARILRDAARLRRVGLVLRCVPVGRPFPDISNHVVEAVAVRRKGVHWRRALVPVGREILVRKLALPGVGQLAPTGREFAAPGELGAVETAACRELPLGFSRKLLACPLGVGFCILKGDMHDRMVVNAADRAAGTVGPTPVRAKLERPPFGPVTRIDLTLGRGKHQRPRLEHVRQGAGVVLRIGRDLGEGDVTRLLDEFSEFAIGDRRAVHPEAVDGDAMNRCLFRIVLLRSHAKRTAGNPDHAVMPTSTASTI